ncbi:MAG: 30S ribosomal protein S13 [Candidatus Krumholzibacteriota bacterium]|nr:30S ribosomal protein S13 [Candidatus Krumholzibacteriota bacterium]
MARIVGVDIPDNKHVEVSLTYIFGLGRSSARKILKQAKVPYDTKTRDLTEEQTVKIRDIIENEYKTEGSLRTEVTMNIKRLMDIGAYRGLRHRHGLPAHGQRTHTNARTRKGPRNRPGSKRKK